MGINSDLYKDYIMNIYNYGQIEKIFDFVAMRFIEHQKGIYPPTIDGLISWINTLRESFSNLKLTISEMVEQNDRIWSRLLLEGTQIKDFMGMQSSGKYFIIDILDEYRFHDQKIVEHWGVFDRFTLLQQINNGSKFILPFGN